MALSFSDITAAAGYLGVEPCAIKAVVDVESAGSGFLPDGRPKILFEGHVFWRDLKFIGIDPEPLARDHPTLIYPKWTKANYRGGPAEHERLNAACNINETSALRSTSWGAFQIMGFNHTACGFDDLGPFVDAMHRSEAAQLKAFCEYMRNNGLIRFLKGRDWAGFARRYNGSSYAENQYDRKLEQAYERCRRSGGV